MGLLTSLFGSRSMENPGVPLGADDWYDLLGGGRASSGVNVNHETALTLSAYWRCVALLTGDFAKLPLCVFTRTKGADGRPAKTEDEKHPAYALVHLEAVPGEIAALQWKRVMLLHALTEGNGYSYIVRDGAGRPIELWPLTPTRTYPVRADRRLWYVTEWGGGTQRQQRKLPAEDVFHLKGLSFDGLVGYSAIAKMRETLGLALAYESFGSIFFRNSARAGVILTHPGKLKAAAKQNLRESWERIHSGIENAHRTAVLEEGMDARVVSINARDAQLLEGKLFSRVDIANFFGVPPHKVGDSSRTSYNSLEQENEGYVEDGGGLGYWLPALAAEAWVKLLSEAEKRQRTHFFAWKTRHLLRANLGARTAYYVAMVNAGILSQDEVREEEGYNPKPDGTGGKFLHPLNMVVEGEEPPPATGAGAKAPPPIPKPAGDEE